MAKSPSKHIGTELEERIIEIFKPLRGVPDRAAKWHDAITVDVLYPESADKLLFGGIALVEKNTPIEVKGTFVKTQNGDGLTSGRWYFKREAHGTLLRENGVYLLVVYTRGKRNHLERIVIPASIIDEHLRGRWYEVGGSRSEGEVAQLAWPHILYEDSIRREAGRTGGQA